MKDKDLSSDIPATVWPVLLFGIVMPVGAILILHHYYLRAVIGFFDVIII